MTEPLFFDCLTDTQFWSLFDAGVLHGCMLPMRVYRRLERIAPDHGCFLFTCPAGTHPPSLHDIISGLALPGEEPSAPTHSNGSEPCVAVERMHSEIEAFCERLNTDLPPAGGRIHVISTHPHPELRAGPYLEPQARDLNAMSLPELEAYLDQVLWLDAGHDARFGASLESDLPR
jgi:hypothetical protein